MIREAPLLCLVLILTLVIVPASANTEYVIVGSPIIVGTFLDVPINVSHSASQPQLGSMVYSDDSNETWVILPSKSVDGSLNIIIVPVAESNDYLGWLVSWL